MTAPAYDAATAARLRSEAAEIIGRYPQARSALLPMLHLVQAEDGYVSPRGIAYCAEVLDLTAAEVSAVATFYSQYKRHPNGTYTVGICTNTLCAVLGGDEVFARLAEHLGVSHDETTDDGAITLERVECNAACDYAPVMMVNWEFFDNTTPASAIDVVERLRAGEEVAPTRGAAKVCTFKEVSRVLAGFPDGRADEGVGAGPATLEGLRLAQQNGWTAPAFPAPPRARTPRAPRARGTQKPAAEPAPAGTASTKQASGKPAARRAPAPEAEKKKPAVRAPAEHAPGRTAPLEKAPRRAPRRGAPATGEPATGEPQSSAERQPTTPADTDRRTTTRKRPPTPGEKD